MLNFKNVTKRYNDGNIAVSNIDFNVEDGEFLFVVGTSGAGKSTLVRLLLNIDKPSEGEIIFNDISVPSLSGRRLAYYRRQIGVVFQDFKLLAQKTVYENVAFVLEVARENKINIKKKTHDVLDLVGLYEKRNKFPSELSGGEQQRVAIARAMVNDPIFLIADEPTGNLDSYNAWDTFQLINKINNWGTTVMVVTHDNEIVDSLQKRVIELDKGAIVRDSIGGYSSHSQNNQEEYIHHQDKFPDQGEDLAEYQTRMAEERKRLDNFDDEKEKELEEIHQDFSDRADQSKKILSKLKSKKVKKTKKVEGSDLDEVPIIASTKIKNDVPEKLLNTEKKYTPKHHEDIDDDE